MAAVVGDTVIASITAGAVASTTPITGMTSHNPARIASGSTAGTRNIDRMIAAYAVNSSEMIAWPRTYAYTTSETSFAVTAMRSRWTRGMYAISHAYRRLPSSSR